VVPPSDDATLWYADAVEADFQQGEMLFCVELPFPVHQEGNLEFQFAQVDVIILTQSCDLVDTPNQPPRARQVLLAPLIAQGSYSGKAKWPEALKQAFQGRTSGYYALPKRSDGLPNEHLLVNFYDLITVPHVYLKTVSPTARVRLQAPYREKFVQAFAYSIGRVALPRDPDFTA
jgi:hypothetical protein